MCWDEHEEGLKVFEQVCVINPAAALSADI